MHNISLYKVQDRLDGVYMRFFIEVKCCAEIPVGAVRNVKLYIGGGVSAYMVYQPKGLRFWPFNLRLIDCRGLCGVFKGEGPCIFG